MVAAAADQLRFHDEYHPLARPLPLHLAKLAEEYFLPPTAGPDPVPHRDVRDRARDVNRLAMFLEDGGIKLSSVVSDITGRSARAMLDALVAGERDPRVLAGLALGSLQGKVPLLIRALTGDFNDHHAFMIASMLRAID